MVERYEFGEDEELPIPEEEEVSEENAGETGNNDSEMPESVEVVGVRFRTSGKVYYFDPCGIRYPEGSHAVVETARGLEYGEVSFSNCRVKGKDVVAPLRRAIRVATPEDDAHYEENRRREKEAFDICLDRIDAHGLDMKLVDAEYTFDNTKLLFYFTADGRVDFRDLVKNLAGVFRCRIELRQLGIRDEAKVLGGLGICGLPYCCHGFLPDFVQVSIKMAKEQGLSLNAAKISGACGRLMCCLRYEYDTYLEEGKRTPKVGSTVHNDEGDYIVVEAKPLTGMLKVRPAGDPDAATLILSRDTVEPGPGPERPVAPKKPVIVTNPSNIPFRPSDKKPERGERGERRERREGKPEQKKKNQNAPNANPRPGRQRPERKGQGGGKQGQSAGRPIPQQQPQPQNGEKPAAQNHRPRGHRGGRRRGGGGKGGTPATE